MVGKRERGQPCQCALMVKCRLEGREFGCQREVGEVSSCWIEGLKENYEDTLTPTSPRTGERVRAAKVNALREWWSSRASVILARTLAPHASAGVETQSAAGEESLRLNRRWGSHRVEGQLQIKCAAGEVDFIVPRTFHPNLAAMRPRHAAHNRQSQTGSAALESCFA